MAFRSGDIIYFKECRNGSKPKKSTGARFKGHGLGMFLGHVGPFEKEPTPEECIKLVGATGFLSFDDVAEFLGDEQAKLCVDRYEAKYYKPEDAAPQVKEPGGRPVLVSADGKTPLGEPKEPRLLLNPKDQEALDRVRAQRRAGEVKPLITATDIQNQIKSLTPEQIRKALTDGEAAAKSQLKRELTKVEVSAINKKVCDALGVDPETLQRLKPSGETAESAPPVEAGPVSPLSENEEDPFALARGDDTP